MANNELKRANRIAITTNEDNAFKADFWRTHTRIATINSVETGWQPNADHNRTAQREDFRQYVIANAESYGIDWNPKDLRTNDNKRVAKYTCDAELVADATTLVYGDIVAFNEKCPHYEGAEVVISVDDITPVATTQKGIDLSNLGVTDGKYDKSGNWAWATIPMSATIKVQDTEIYVSFDCHLVSGQLKKPIHIGDLGFNQTAWNTAIKAEMESAGLILADTKEVADDINKDKVVEEPKPTEEKAKGKSKSKGKSKGKGKSEEVSAE